VATGTYENEPFELSWNDRECDGPVTKAAVSVLPISGSLSFTSTPGAGSLRAANVEIADRNGGTVLRIRARREHERQAEAKKDFADDFCFQWVV